jgi:hypothetical protein
MQKYLPLGLSRQSRQSIQFQLTQQAQSIQ